MNLFKGRHFKYDIIIWAVRWYCKYGISYRDLEEMLVDEAKATHSGFGFLFPFKNHFNVLDPQNERGLSSEISIASPSMLHTPIEMPSSISIINHVWNDSSSIGGVDHHTSISSANIGIGIGFSGSPFSQL